MQVIEKHKYSSAHTLLNKYRHCRIRVLRLIKTLMNMQNKRLLIIVSVVVFILLIPLIAMQFTNEVNWSLFDFIAAAVLLLGTGLLCELVMRKVKKNRDRIIVCFALLLILLLIWAELAVGILGSPVAGH
jgi:peptidoglycan/LPS O-acetylase OafA/YrhL